MDSLPATAVYAEWDWDAPSGSTPAAGSLAMVRPDSDHRCQRRVQQPAFLQVEHSLAMGP